MIRGETAPSLQRRQSLILRTLVWAAGCVTIAISVSIVVYILVSGIPHLRPSLFSFTYTSENSSLMPALANTLLALCTTLAMALLAGVGAAIYLSEYARGEGLVVKAVRIAAQTLSAIPSIVYGLFGFLFFVTFLGWGFSLLAGCSTLAVMVLPVIVRTAEEALLSVPIDLREGSYALGAAKVRTVFCVVLPHAMPGIAVGAVLAVGRVLGESAALIYTAGTVAKVAPLSESGRTLAVHLWALWSEGGAVESSWGAAVVLMVVVLLLNFASSRLEHMIIKRR